MNFHNFAKFSDAFRTEGFIDSYVGCEVLHGIMLEQSWAMLTNDTIICLKFITVNDYYVMILRVRLNTCLL